jgi:hypothetical protein
LYYYRNYGVCTGYEKLISLVIQNTKNKIYCLKYKIVPAIKKIRHDMKIAVKK